MLNSARQTPMEQLKPHFLPVRKHLTSQHEYLNFNLIILFKEFPIFFVQCKRSHMKTHLTKEKVLQKEMSTLERRGPEEQLGPSELRNTEDEDKKGIVSNSQRLCVW